MIKNDLQYRVAKSSLRKFRETFQNHDCLTADQEPWVRQLHKETIAGEIKKLESDIEEYEMLKSGKASALELDVIEQIGSLLIKKRIALGWTQVDLAKRLNVKAQQVQADEANNYSSASLARMVEIARVLRSGRRKAPEKDIKSESAIEDLLMMVAAKGESIEQLSVADNEIESLACKPAYVLEELVHFAQSTVSDPNVVFLGLRKDGPLSKGKAYCGSPKALKAYKDKVFLVYVDADNYVFDWGWVGEDPRLAGYPLGWKSRFLGRIDSGAGASIANLDQVKQGSFEYGAAWFSDRGDCIFAYANDKPSYMQRCSDNLTLLLDVKDNSLNGFKLKNIRKLLRSIAIKAGDRVQTTITIEDAQGSKSHSIEIPLSALTAELKANTEKKAYAAVVEDLDRPIVIVPGGDMLFAT